MFSLIKEGIQKYKKHIYNTTYYLFAALIGSVFQLVLNPFVALFLEHRDYAIIGYYTSFNALLMPLITFSLPTYYSRHYFYIDVAERESLRNKIIVMTLIFSGIMSIISVIGLWLFCNVTNVSFPFFPYAIISIASIFFNGIYTILVVDIKLKRKALQFFKLHIIHAIVSAALTILLVIIFKWAAVGKMLAPALTAMIFCIYSIKKMLTKFEFDYAIFKKVIYFCWPLAIAAALNFFFSGVDRPMLERLHDEKSLGLYSIALTITGYLSLFSNAISDTFQPDILESIAKRQKKKTVTIIGGIICLNAIPIIIFILFAPIIINLLTFGRFTDAAPFSRILALRNISSGVYFSISSVIIGYGWSRITLYNKLIGSVIAFIMFRVLISNFGFYGAAWGQVFSFLIMSLISMIFILGQGRAKKLNKSIKEHLYNKRILK